MAKSFAYICLIKSKITDYMAIIKMVINFTINASNQKAPFEILYGKTIPLLVDFLLSRESSINLQAHKSSTKIKKLLKKVKYAIYNA